MSVNVAHAYFVAPLPVCEFSPVGAHEHAVRSLQALHYIFSGCVRPNGSLRVTSGLNLESLSFTKQMNPRKWSPKIQTPILSLYNLIYSVFRGERADTGIGDKCENRDLFYFHSELGGGRMGVCVPSCQVKNHFWQSGCFKDTQLGFVWSNHEQKRGWEGERER